MNSHPRDQQGEGVATHSAPGGMSVSESVGRGMPGFISRGSPVMPSSRRSALMSLEEERQIHKEGGARLLHGSRCREQEMAGNQLAPRWRTASEAWRQPQSRSGSSHSKPATAARSVAGGIRETYPWAGAPSEQEKAVDSSGFVLGMQRSAPAHLPSFTSGHTPPIDVFF